MSLVERLECECTPGKVYASKSSLRGHYKSVRHTEYARRSEERQLRILLGENERRIAKLESERQKLMHYLMYPQKRTVSERTKKEVAALANWKCQRCGELVNANYEIDHVIPLFRAGDNAVENLQCLCPDCHRTKTASDRQ